MNNHFLLSIFVLFLSSILLERCANPGVVSGGPKDTIPPTLVSSYPVDQTTNFNGQTLTLEFDEYIAADKIHQSLIISPTTSNKFKHLLKKQTLTLKFEEPFKDSTTYTFNFFDAVTDITEKNPPINLVLAFSTGDFIDSLKVFGTLKSMMSDKPLEKAIVGLYPKTDTLDIFTDKPIYFTTTDKYGIFHIQNIKYGEYKILAFADKNNNLKFEPKEEAYAFKKGFFNPIDVKDSLYLFSIDVDASPLKLNSARVSGHYYDLRYSKKIDKYQIIDSDSATSLQSNLDDTREIIHFYNPFEGYPNDSVYAVVKAIDSLKNITIDTVYVQFRESSRKQPEFTFQVSPSAGANVADNQVFSILFNKPIHSRADSTIIVQFDSLHSFGINHYESTWNHNKTQIFLYPQITQKTINDSLDIWISSIAIDSLQPDSSLIREKKFLESYPPNKLSIVLPPYSFISIEGDSSALYKAEYKFRKPEDYGTLRVNVTSTDEKFFIQLLEQNKTEAYKEIYNCESCLFQFVKPGNYQLRFLLDENQDGKWDIGNILEDREPEPVRHTDTETVIRSNFDMELDISL